MKVDESSAVSCITRSLLCPNAVPSQWPLFGVTRLMDAEKFNSRKRHPQPLPYGAFHTMRETEPRSVSDNGYAVKLRVKSASVNSLGGFERRFRCRLLPTS